MKFAFYPKKLEDRVSGYAMRRYPAGYEFPVPFGVPAVASCAFLCPLRD
jgi:hypothetical protein